MTSLIDLMHSLSPQGPELRFIVAAIVVVIVGVRLGVYGDILSEKLGLGHALVGLILMAFATSVPELVTSVSAAVVQGEPNLALGNCFGSNVFNVVILALLDVVIGKERLFAKVALKMAVAAAVSILVTGAIAVAMAVDVISQGSVPAPLGVGLGCWAAAVAYVLGTYIIKKAGSETPAAPDDVVPEADEGQEHKDASTGLTLAKYAGACAVILWAGLNLSRAGDDLATKYGLGQTFVGTMLLALATSLPEVASCVGMVLRGHFNMAFGNLFGSNTFNIMVIVVSDLFFRQGRIVDAALYGGANGGANGGADGGVVSADGQLHFLTIFMGILLTAIAIIGIVMKPKNTRIRMSWPGIAIILVYIAGAYMLYLLSGSA